MSIIHFQQLDAADLIINIWLYNQNKEHLAICPICKRYTDLSIQALRDKWEEDWGDFEYLVKKLVKTNKQYINLGAYSSETKHQIIHFIKKYNKKN